VPVTDACPAASASCTADAVASTSVRLVVQASVTASSTCRNDGRPCTGTGGKYVPA
jgi:hypothetical protein